MENVRKILNNLYQIIRNANNCFIGDLHHCYHLMHYKKETVEKIEFKKCIKLRKYQFYMQSFLSLLLHVATIE